MSGHSHWATIKRKKGAADAARGKVFTRLGRELTVAAREGGGNLDGNVRLRLAIEKARAANMPKDNIERAVQRGAGGGDDAIIMEELTYEGYGPHGVAVLVDVLTDNKNRSLSAVRQVFNKGGGTFGAAGAVSWQFDRIGRIEVRAEGVDPDELFMAAADAGAEDVVPADEETIEVITPRELLGAVEAKLVQDGYKVSDAGLRWQAKNEVDVEGQSKGVQVMEFLERLEELDDVQAVASTLHITDELAEAYAEAE
jgi:YebC/PmpR family DNA-binding regulatory protein